MPMKKPAYNLAITVSRSGISTKEFGKDAKIKIMTSESQCIRFRSAVPDPGN